MASDEAAKEIRAHETSYHRFLFMMKWGTILSVITGFIVILIIAK
ncbi:MAG TPA: aa3-type cytochrome c oxidase subunit IV [Allosphingosinicella sp.]|nr:aa3-type cytochrome c oxidase subunit IV [Allosphingosinicella sp.]